PRQSLDQPDTSGTEVAATHSQNRNPNPSLPHHETPSERAGFCGSSNERRPEVARVRCGAVPQAPYGGAPLATAYCVKCKAKREMKGPQQITFKNGRPATQGVCPVCGTKIVAIGKAS